MSNAWVFEITRNTSLKSRMHCACFTRQRAGSLACFCTNLTFCSNACDFPFVSFRSSSFFTFRTTCFFCIFITMSGSNPRCRASIAVNLNFTVYILIIFEKNNRMVTCCCNLFDVFACSFTIHRKFLRYFYLDFIRIIYVSV